MQLLLFFLEGLIIIIILLNGLNIIINIMSFNMMIFCPSGIFNLRIFVACSSSNQSLLFILSILIIILFGVVAVITISFNELVY